MIEKMICGWTWVRRKCAHRSKIRAIIAIFLCVFLILGEGCSPGMFFGNSKDDKVLNAPLYRKVNTACAGMNLSSSTLDVPTFRSMIRCFNANHSMDEIDQLINGGTGSTGLKDEELKPLVSLANRYILNDQKRLYEIERSYQVLSQRGIVKNTFEQMGKLLENEKLISSGIALLKDGYYESSQSKKPDIHLLKSFEIIAENLSEQNWSRLLDLGIQISGAEALQDLQVDFKKEVLSQHQLKDLIRSLYDYLHEEHTYVAQGKTVEIRRELFATIEDGTLFSTLNQIMGTSPEQLKGNIPRLTSILKKTLERPLGTSHTQSPLMYQLVNAFHDLDGESIPCMKNARQISDPRTYILNELTLLSSPEEATQYILQGNVLTLATFSPFCNYPLSLKRAYSNLVNIAETGAMVPMTDLIKKLHKTPALVTFLVNFLSDKGKSGTDGGVLQLIPVLQGIQDHDAWEDLFLVMTTPGESSRVLVQDILQSMIRPLPQLGGQRIYDVWLKAILRNDFEHLYRFAESLRDYLYDDNFKAPFLNKALTTLRQAYYVNNVHPFLGLIQDVMKDASQEENSQFFGTLFLISERKEFLNTLKWISVAAQNGRLEKLVADVISLFHKFAEQGKSKTQIEEYSNIPGVPSAAHHLRKSDLNLMELKPQKINEDCRALLDFDLPINQASSPQFEDTVSHILKCRSSNGHYGNLVNAIQFFMDRKSNGESFLSFMVSATQNLLKTPQPLTGDNTKYLVNQWLSEFQMGKESQISWNNDASFVRLVNAVPLWVNGVPQQPQKKLELFSIGSPIGSVTPSSEPVLQPLLGMMRPLIFNVRSDLEELETYMGQVVARDEFPGWLTSIDYFFQKEKKSKNNQQPPAVTPVLNPALTLASNSTEIPVPLPSSSPSLTPQQQLDEEIKLIPESLTGAVIIPKDISGVAVPSRESSPPFKSWDPVPLKDPKFIEEIKKWVRYKECKQDENEILIRTQEILSEVRLNVTNVSGDWEFPRQSWTLEDLKKLLGPVFEKIAAQDTQSEPGHWVLDASLNFFKYFNQSSTSTGNQPNPGAGNGGTGVGVEVASNPWPPAHYPPEKLLEWVRRRSRDYRLITYYYRGEPGPRVRLVNTLDLMELVVVNVDFVAPRPISKNLALDFLTELALAWGDLDQSQWPPEFQQSGKTPKTLKAAVRDIVDRHSGTSSEDHFTRFTGWLGTLTNWFSKENLTNIMDRVVDGDNLTTLTNWYVGLPQFPSCVQPVPNEPPDPQKAAYLGSILKAFLGTEEYSKFQARLYNVWQVATVLQENIPGGNRPDYKEGLEVLRDLFYELYASTPVNARNFTSGDANNLSIITRSVRMGNFRQIGRMVDAVPLNDPTLHDFFMTVVQSAKTNEMRDLLSNFFTKDVHQELMWKLITKVFAVIDSGNAEDLANMKQTLFYGLALPSKFDKNGNLIQLSLGSFNSVLNDHFDFLKSKADLLENALTSKDAALWARIIYEEDAQSDPAQKLLALIKDFLDPAPKRMSKAVGIYKVYSQDGDASKLGDLFTKRMDALLASTEYKNLQLDPILRSLLYFFEQRDSNGNEMNPQDPAKDLSQRLRKNLGQLLQDKAMTRFLALAAGDQNQPTDLDKFYQELQSLSGYLQLGNHSDLEDFLKIILRSLSESNPST